MTLRNAFADLASELTLSKLATAIRVDGSGRTSAQVAGVDFDGTARTLRTDPVGRLKISHAQPDPVTADLVAVGDSIILSLESLSDATFYFRGAAHAGYNLTFETSPNTTATPGYRPTGTTTDGDWFPVIAKNAGSTATSATTGVLTSNSATGFEVSAPAAVAVRARVTARTSGTLAAQGTGSTAARPTSLGVSGSVSVSGSVTVSSLTPGSGASNLGKAEDQAHASSDVGIMALGVRAPATPSTPTSAAGDYSYLQVDVEGKLVTTGSADPAQTFQNVTLLTTAASTLARAAQAAGIRTVVTDVTLSNATSTGTRVDVLDGTTSMWSAWVPAGATVEKSFRTPLRGTAATALNVQSSTVLADLRVSLGGYSAV